MRKNYPLIKNAALTLATALLICTSCTETIDIDEVNGAAEVKTSIASPIVTVKTTLADILDIDTTDNKGQSNEVDRLYAKIGSNNDDQLTDAIPYGTLYYRDTFFVNRNFHEVELQKYLLPADTMYLPYSQVASQLNNNNSLITIPAGTDLRLQFDAIVRLNGINSPDLDDRIDSMIINYATLLTNIESSFGLTSGELRNLEITLPEQITCYGMPGSTLAYSPVYTSNVQMSRQLNNLNICLHDGKSQPGNRRAHALRQLTFRVCYNIHTLRSHTVDASSTLHCRLNLRLNDYEALYGYFTPSTYMEDRDKSILEEEWDGWRDIKRLQMKFIYPTVKLTVKHQIGTEIGFPLNVNATEVWVAPMNNGNIGEKRYAMFGENGDQRSTVWEMYDPKRSYQTRIAPLTDPFNKVARNEYMCAYTGYDPATHRGDVDKMLEVRPDIIYYDYHITVGEDGNKAALETQNRLVKNTIINLQAVAVIPFVCAENSAFEYADTVAVDFASISIDSLINSQDWLDTIVDGNAYIYIYAKNKIPYNLTLTYHLIDNNGNEVYLPLVTENEGTEASYHTTIPAPTEFDNEGKATNYGENTVILKADRQQYDQLKNVDRLVFSVAIADNPQTATIWYDSALDLKVGVSTNLHTIINLNK